MTKLIKITNAKDELIEKLLNDKNRLYLKLKKLQKEIDVLKNNLSSLRNRCKIYEKRQKELLNELFEKNNNAVKK